MEEFEYLHGSVKGAIARALVLAAVCLGRCCIENVKHESCNMNTEKMTYKTLYTN